MAFTPAMPIFSTQMMVSVPLSAAVRVIPGVTQPGFGLQATSTVNGTNPLPNDFYRADIAYHNRVALGGLLLNMQENRYLAMIPGLMKSPIPAGGS